MIDHVISYDTKLVTARNWRIKASQVITELSFLVMTSDRVVSLWEWYDRQVMVWRLCVVRCHVQGFVLAVYGQCNIILEIFYHGWWFYIIPGLLNIRIWKLSYSFLKQHSHICRLFCMKGRGCSYWMSSCKFTFSPPYISLFWKKCRRFMQGGLNKLYNAIYLLSMVWWSWWF